MAPKFYVWPRFLKINFNLIRILFVIVFCFNSAHAQKVSYGSVDVLTGKIISNHPAFPDVENAALLFRFRAGMQLTGYKDWHRYYNYPGFGINAVTGSLGSKSIFGNIFGIMPEMTLKQQLKGKFSLNEGIALGVAYFNKKYDEGTNPANIAIGSHFTAFASATFRLNYEMNERWMISLSGNVLHGSNLHLALPNLGVNLPAIGAGVQYALPGLKHTVADKVRPAFDKKIHFNIKAGLGINEQGSSTAPTNGPKYPIYMAALSVAKKYSYVNKVSAGIEGYYNTGVYDFIVTQNLFKNHEREKSYAAYLFAGHEFLFGHFSLSTVVGGYLYNPFYKSEYLLYYSDDFKAKIKTTVVFKLGVQYYFWNAHTRDKYQLYISSYVKTNFGQADFWENSIGWQF